MAPKRKPGPGKKPQPKKPLVPFRRKKPPNKTVPRKPGQ